MKTKDLVPDLKPYVKGAVENDYARERIAEGADSIREGLEALTAGRDHPKRRLGRRLALLAGVGLVGAGAAIGYRELHASR